MTKMESAKAEGYKEAEDKFVKAIHWKLALYGGFQPQVAEVLLAILEKASPEAYEETLKLIPIEGRKRP